MRNELVMEGPLEWTWVYDDITVMIDGEDFLENAAKLLKDSGSSVGKLDNGYTTHPHVRLVLSLGANDA